MSNISDILNIKAEEPKTGSSTSVNNNADVNHTTNNMNSINDIINSNPINNVSSAIQDYSRRMNSYGISQVETSDEVQELKDKLKDKGIYNTYTHDVEELTDLLGKQQGAVEKIAKMQGKLANEVVLGTVGILGNLLDVGINAITDSPFYEAHAAKPITDLKEYIDNDLLYVHQDANHISEGGILDLGFIANNVPSVASSLILMIPGAAAGKVAGLGVKLGGKAVRTGANVLSKATKATKLERVGDALATTAYNTKLGGTITSGVELTSNAVMSRFSENYQEAQQVYSSTVEQYNKAFNDPNFDYNTFIERNADILEGAEGLDINNKLDVAKYMASKAANTTFAMDWINVVFDIAQLAALGNIFKVNEASRLSLHKAARNYARYGDVEDDALKALLKERTIKQKLLDKVDDIKFLSTRVILPEATEGIEEQINYISQEEGYNFANLTLNKADANRTFNSRLGEYINSPELWDSAFWGFMGGITFGAAYSKVQTMAHNLKNKKDIIEERKKDPNYDATKPAWRLFDDLPEIKRQKAALRHGINILNSYNASAQVIAGNDNLTQEEKDEQIADLKQDIINKVTLSALNGNCPESMRAMLENEDIKHILVESGLATEDNIDAIQRQLLTSYDKVSNNYYSELNRVNKIAAGFGREISESIPLGYLQLAANRNLVAINGIDRYEQFIDKENQTIAQLSRNTNVVDNDRAIEVEAIGSRLATLQARLETLNRDKENDIFNVTEVQNIKKEIKDLSKSLNDAEFLFALDRAFPVLQAFGSTNMLTSLLYKRNNNFLTHTGNVNKLRRHQTIFDAIGHGERFKKLVDLYESEGKLEIEAFHNPEQQHPEISKQLTDLRLQYKDLFVDEDKQSRNTNPALYEAKFRRKALKLQRDYFAKTKITDLEGLKTFFTNFDNTFDEARKNAVKLARKNFGIWYARNPIRFSKAITDIIEGRTPNLEYVLNADEQEVFEDTLDVLRLTDKRNRHIKKILKEVLENQIKADYANAVLNRDITKLEKEQREQNQKNSLQNNNSSNQQTQQQQSNPSNQAQNSATNQQSSQSANATQQSTQQPQQNGNQQQGNGTSINGIVNPTPTPTPAPTRQQVVRPDTIPDTRSAHVLHDAVLDDMFEVEFLNDDYDLNYFTDNGVNLTQEVVCRRRPLVYWDEDKGKYEIQRKGELINVGTIGGQAQAQGQAQAATNQQQEGEESNDDTVEPYVRQNAGQPANVMTPEDIEHMSEEDFEQMNYEDEIYTNFIAYKKQHEGENELKVINDFIRTSTENLQGEERTRKEDAIKTVLTTYKELSEQDGEPLKQEVVAFIDKYSDVLADSTERKVEALTEFLKAYYTDRHLTKVDGKYVINIVDLCDYIKTICNNKELPATIVYEAAVAHINSLPNEFIITDKDELNIYKTYNVASEQKEKARTKPVNSSLSISVNDYIQSLKTEEEKKKVLEAYNKLNLGDELQAERIDNKTVEIKTPDGVTIAKLSMPGIHSSTGDFQGLTDGWTNKVNIKGDIVVSDFRDAIADILIAKSGDKKALKDALLKLSYFNDLTKEEYNKVLNEIINNQHYKNLKEVFANEDNIEQDNKLINGLTKIIGYPELNLLLSENAKINTIIESLNDWFRKTYDTYKQTDDIVNGNSVITIDSINTGSIIKKVQGKVQDPAKELPTISEGIAEMQKAGMKLAVGTNGGYVVAGEEFEETSHSWNGAQAIRIKNRNGKSFYVNLMPAKMKDVKSDEINAYIEDIKKKTYELLSELRTAAKDESIEEYDNVYEKLVNHLRKSFDNRRNLTIFNNLYFSVSDQGAITIGNPKTNSIQFFRRTRNGTSPSIRASLTVNGTQSTKTITTQDNNVYGDIKKLFDTIIGEAKINIINEFVQSNTEYKGNPSRNTGYARFKDGKFVLQVEDSTEHTFDSYNDFVINNDLGYVNLGKDSTGMSNFDTTSEVYQRSATINISVKQREGTNVSPVEESTTSSSSSTQPTQAVEEPSIPGKDNRTKVLNILNSRYKGTQKATRILNLLADKEIVEVLKKYKLVANNVVYDPEYIKGHYGAYSYTRKAIIVGDEFLDLINTKPKEAVRILIHEQIHSKLDNDLFKEQMLNEIESIYNEFKDSVEDSNSDIKRYLNSFESKDREVKLEEFLVETLTSAKFADYLNSVKAKDSEHKSILEKLFDLMTKLLNIQVDNESLLYNELRTIAKLNTTIVGSENIQEIESPTSQTETPVETQQTEVTQTPIVEDEADKEDLQDTVEIEDEVEYEDIYGDDVVEDYDSVDIDMTSMSDILEDEYTQEMQDIKAKAITNGTFMKAPNGQPTNLNERQWIHVRTKAFKDWFGDWESVNRFNLDNIDTSKVDIELVDKPWKNDASKVNKTVRIYLKGQKEKGYFELVKDQEPFMYSVHFKTGDGNTGETYGSTKEERAILYKELINALPKGVQISTWGEISKGGITALNKIGSSMTKVGERQVKDREGNDINIPIYQNGESNVSKVVDENGEPLVVYHSSDNRFDTFNKDKIGSATDPGFYGKGFYFTPDEQYSKPYGDNLYEVFLNIKNPFMATDIETSRASLLYNREDTSLDYMVPDEIKDKYKGTIDNHDGVIHKGPAFMKANRFVEEYIVKDSNQVKSATDNNGNYSKEEDNIYYSDITDDNTIILQIGSSVDFVNRLPSYIRDKVKDKINNFEYKILCK